MTITTPEAIEALCDRLTNGSIHPTRGEMAEMLRPYATTLRTLSAENARLQEALEIMRTAFAGYCTSPMHDDAILIADTALQENK